jgi:hypothetical protein
MKFGGEFHRYIWPMWGFFQNRGYYQYTTGYTTEFGFNDGSGSGLASMLLSLPAVKQRQAGIPQMDLRAWGTAAFAEDSWQVTPTTTLNLGLRYEYTSPLYDKQNTNTNLIFNNGVPSVFIGGELGYPRGLMYANKHNFAPRVGIRIRGSNGSETINDFQRDFGAREWGRTITALRPPDFESGASASSATRAHRQDIIGLESWPIRTTGTAVRGCYTRAFLNVMADDLYRVNLQSVGGSSLYRLIHEFTSMERQIGDRPREGYLLDYKEDVSDRFLRSVAAFANTFGGLLIVGVTEKDGRPDTLAGVSVQGEWKTKIASMIAANLFPCPQFEIAECALPTDAGRKLSVVRVRETPEICLLAKKGEPHPCTFASKINPFQPMLHSYVLSLTGKGRTRRLRRKSKLDWCRFGTACG